MSTLTVDQGNELVAAFESWRGDAPAISHPDLQAFVRDVRVSLSPEWSCTVENVISTLTRHGALSEVEIPSEGDYRGFRRYITPDATTYDIAMTLRAKGYFSHATAVFAHRLTDQIPQTIYLNAEQSEKPTPTGSLTQAGLDRAFRARQRISRYAFVYGRQRIVILNGKQTRSLGVTPMSFQGRNLPVTDLERTLIDIAVRPVYGGGIYEIMAAYRAAVDRLDVSTIVDYLAALDYRYPYHQAIGFYLERAGATVDRTQPLRDLGLDFDFYLLHGLTTSTLDKSWRVHVPEGL